MYLWQEIYEEAAKLDASDKDKFLELVQTSKIQTGEEGLDADDSERWETHRSSLSMSDFFSSILLLFLIIAQDFVTEFTFFPPFIKTINSLSLNKNLRTSSSELFHVSGISLHQLSCKINKLLNK